MPLRAGAFSDSFSEDEFSPNAMRRALQDERRGTIAVTEGRDLFGTLFQ